MLDRDRAVRRRSGCNARRRRLAATMLVGATLGIVTPIVGYTVAAAPTLAVPTTPGAGRRAPAPGAAVPPSTIPRAAVPPPATHHAAPPPSATQEPREIARSPLYRWLEEHRDAAYWAAPLLMITVAILPIPAEIPAAMNGMLFGAVVGVLITWGGAMAGAAISYELARYFGAGLTRRFVKPEAMARLEGMRNTEAAVLLALRLTPVVAFTLVNWACGLLRVRRSTFLWTTAVGILPGAIAFTISGSAMAVLYQRYPGTVTAVTLAALALILLRAWWAQRRATSPAASGPSS